MDEYEAPHRKELRRKATSRRPAKAEILFVITLVAFVVYVLFINSVVFSEGAGEWRWSYLRMLFSMVGVAIGGLAVISLVLSALKLAKVLKKKIHASPYPPLLFIALNVCMIIAVILIMRQKLNIEL